MPRTVSFEVPADTSLFTPLQLQPRFVMQSAMSGWARWLREYAVSFPELIHRHQFGVVVAGISLAFTQAFGFKDGATVNLATGVRVIGAGNMLQVDHVLSNADRAEVVRARVLLIPLRLSGDDSMSATPTRVEGELLGFFKEDETNLPRPEREVGPLIKQLQQSGAPLASSALTLRLWRHLCEVADQWSFIETPGFAAAGRENLVLLQGSETAALREGLSRPLRRVDIELTRPGFLFDEVKVESSAWLLDGKPAFAHTLKGDQAALGTIIERF
jgi:hypothetical protein